MPKTYEPIQTQTVVGTSTTTVTFSSIPQTYTDLILVFNGESTGTQGYRVRVGNGSIDTSTIYSETFLVNTGSTAGSGRRTGFGAFVDPSVYTSRNLIITQFMNYSNTSTFKSVLWRFNNVANELGAQVGLYRSTSAINIIDATAHTYFFTAGSTFTLYGIKAA